MAKAESPKATTAQSAKREDAPSNPYVAAVLAWVIPGAGHLYLGRRVRAFSFCALVLTSLVVGLALEGKLYVIVPDQPLSRLATLSCMGMGVPYWITRYAVGYEGNILGVGYEYGAAFILTAGLMNLLLILDSWDIARGLKE